MWGVGVEYNKETFQMTFTEKIILQMKMMILCECAAQVLYCLS